MADKENQHTVPQFYLRQFTPEHGDKILWEYAKTNPTRPSRKSPRDVAAESFFYSKQLKDGSWDHSLEDTLNKVETITAPAYKRLIENEPLKRGDRQIVAQFIGLMVMRTKGPRDAANAHVALLESPQFASDYVRLNDEALCAIYGRDKVQEFIDRVERSGQGLLMPKNFHLTHVFDRADRWGERIMQMSWTIWTARPPAFFLTSDNPAFARKPSYIKSPGIVGIDRDDLYVELGFPLSSTSFLIARWGQRGGQLLSHMNASAMRVLALNTRTVLSATEHVFSPEKSSQIEALVKEHKDFRLQYPKYTQQDLLTALRQRTNRDR